MIFFRIYAFDKNCGLTGQLLCLQIHIKFFTETVKFINWSQLVTNQTRAKKFEDSYMFKVVEKWLCLSVKIFDKI